MRTNTRTKGFTLIELAVVIAIIAILAAVAIPRFGDTTIQAERAKAKDLASQLTSAASIYTAEQASTPNSFSEFVEFTSATASSPKTISVRNFTDPAGSCQSGAASFSCTLKKWTVTYTYNSGSVTVSGTANGHSQTF